MPTKPTPGVPAIAALVAVALFSPAFGQDAGKDKAKEQAPAAAPPPSEAAMPEAEAIVVLIRTALLTLNDALRTGNFTVLRDTAAPSFREANSAARLSRIFEDLEKSGVDLAPVAVAVPQLAEAPSRDARGMLHIKGYFPLAAARIDFALVFEMVGGRWRLFGIAAQPSAPAANSAERAAPAPKAPDAKAAGKKPKSP